MMPFFLHIVGYCRCSVVCFVNGENGAAIMMDSQLLPPLLFLACCIYFFSLARITFLLH